MSHDAWCWVWWLTTTHCGWQEPACLGKYNKDYSKGHRQFQVAGGTTSELKPTLPGCSRVKNVWCVSEELPLLVHGATFITHTLRTLSTACASQECQLLPHSEQTRLSSNASW